MNKRQCSRGHIYDADIYGETCPLCNTEVKKLSPVIPGLSFESVKTVPNSKRNACCPFCGFPSDIKNGEVRCPNCGANFSSGYEKLEVSDEKGNNTTIVRLQSERDVYYEYNPNKPPLWEDAWGKYYLGRCYSKYDSRFLKEVTLCDSYARYYIPSMWRHIEEEHLDFKNTAFISIVDYISGYFIEDYYNGVSLYDLIHGQVCGIDGQPIKFAVMMYEKYHNSKIDFAKMVAINILKLIISIHHNDIAIRFIELPENIIFTESGEIKIRARGSLLSVCKHDFTILDDYETLWPFEYCAPERYLQSECSEIYAVGVLFYSILTDHLPYEGSTSLEDCHLVHEPYIDPRDDTYKERPSVRTPSRGYDKLLLTEIHDIHLRKVIEKATRENPSKRFQSALEFINGLEGSMKV